MNIKYARILNTYCPTGDAVNPVCGRLASTWKGRTWRALSSPDGHSPLPARAGKGERTGFSPGQRKGGAGFSPSGAAGGAEFFPLASRQRPPVPGRGASAAASPAGTSRSPHSGTRGALPGTAGLRRGLRAGGSARDQQRRGATREGAPLGALALSQRVIRGMSSYGSTKPLKIKLRTSPGILSWAFYHRSYSLGLNHRCLSLVLLSVLTTWFPSTVNKHQRLCRNQLRLPSCCTQLTWLQI